MKQVLVIVLTILTAEAQVLYHQGYEKKEKGMLLCRTFGLSIPEEYEKQ